MAQESRTKRIDKNEIINKTWMVFAAIVVVASIILGRIYYLQGPQRNFWLDKVKKTTIINAKIPALRGDILAADGSLLATSTYEYMLEFDPEVADKSKGNAKAFHSNIKNVCNALSRIYPTKSSQFFYNKIMAARGNQLPDTIISQRQRNEKPKTYLNNVTLSISNLKWFQKLSLDTMKFVQEGSNKSGLIFTEIPKRTHPFGSLALRTLGIVTDSTSKVYGKGLEASFNRYLAGRPGRGTYEILKRKKYKMPLQDTKLTKPVHGLNIQTTLDVNMQDVTETALRNAIEKYKPKYATAIVMEVATGHIKALANLGLDPKTHQYSEDINYAIAHRSQPGSTFKLPTMMALLEEGYNPETMVATGNGVFPFLRNTIRDTHANGTLNGYSIIEQSSNVGIAKLALQYFGKDDQIYFDYLKKFNLRRKTGVQLIGEPSPKFYDSTHPSHSKYSLPFNSFGGIESLVTPLQMLCFYNAIANNGYWVQPLLVSKALHGNTIIANFEASQRIGQSPICSEKTVKTLQKMLEGVVNNGTAKKIKPEGYTIAGKTGTSRKYINGNFNNQSFYCAFAGYFPANKPKYSCIVVVDQPQMEGQLVYAGDAAAPVFKFISDHIYADDLSMVAPNKTLLTQKNAKSVAVLLADAPKLKSKETMAIAYKQRDIAVNPNRYSEQNTVPDLRGLPLRDALYVLENRHFTVKYKGKGKVQEQSLSPGLLAQDRTEIILSLN
jgi:cell division protein FtsI (penicillin-binding protein 3)